MKRTDIKPNWDFLSRRATWSYMSVSEVAKLLGISIQSVHNWVSRGQLPKPDDNPHARGNKSWFRVSSIKAFLEKRTEDEIHWEWIKTQMPNENFQTIGQAQYLVKYCYELLNVEKPIIKR